MEGTCKPLRRATWLAAMLALTWSSSAAVSQDAVSEPVVQDVPPSFADSFPSVPEPDTAPGPADGHTSSGEVYDMYAMTAAHRTLPFGTRLRVTNPRTGASVVVRINDRGPFHGSRIIDVSRAAAEELGLVGRGHGLVELALVD